MGKIRDKGEGSVFQRNNGKWVAEFRVGTKPNGKANTKTFTGKTEQEVKKKLKQFKTEFIKNDFIDVKKITVKNYMDNWLYTVKINELKPKSLDIKENILQNQIYPYIGDIQIGNLKNTDVQNLINTLVAKGYSYSTIRKAYDNINSCFKLGVIKDDIIKNPCAGVSPPTKLIVNYSKEITFFDDEQIEAICKESIFQYGNKKMMYRLGHSIIVLLYTGMRRGELLGLKWKDIDFDNKTVKISNSVVSVKNRSNTAKTKYVLIEQNSTKTSSGDRIIPLNLKAVDALQEIRKINTNSEYVMSNGNGNIINPRNFDRMFRNILNRCGIEPCGVHALRHTFASMLFKKGVDVKTVSELLGHADVKITYNTYIHLIKEQKQQAVALLDEL